MLGFGIEKVLERVAKLEYPDMKHMDLRAFEVRPILPRDLGLDDWIWLSKLVHIRSDQYLAIGGIHSEHLLQVEFRVMPSMNIRAIATTGQPLYDGLFVRKHDSLWVNWKSLERLGDKEAIFSIQGFIIEPTGYTVTG